MISLPFRSVGLVTEGWVVLKFDIPLNFELWYLTLCVGQLPFFFLRISVNWITTSSGLPFNISAIFTTGGKNI